VRPGATGCGDRPREDDAAVFIEFAAGLRDEVGDHGVIDVESALDHRCVVAGADETRIGRTPEDEG
jgi:hypothetical protein